LGRLNTNIVLLIIVFITNISYAQVKDFDAMPKERISINTNAVVFVTGESLLYKIDCFVLNQHSNLSKIAYALLVNDAGKIIFKQKIKLEMGTGNADYYIPTSLKTGNYKLCAYTNWMKNNKENSFSYVDIAIVNPYIKNKETSLTLQNDSLVYKKSLNLNEVVKQEGFELKTNATRFNTRSKVVVNLINLNQDNKNGSYYMSVRKVDSVALVKHKSQEKTITVNNNLEFYLPELRGEIISGKVVSKETGVSIPNKVVALSITGNRDIYKTSKTNSLGIFYFNVSKNYNSGDLIIQINDDYAADFKIVLDEQKFMFESLSFNKLVLNKNTANWIVEKSINNQIETAYFASKKDSIVNSFIDKKFYDKTDADFVLDDYKRFKTIKETFVEVIEGAGIEKHKGKYEVVVYTAQSIFDTQLRDLKTLLIVDGIPVFNHEVFINMKPSSIKRISLVKGAFFHGPSIYKNILIAETIKKDFILPKTEVFFNKPIISLVKSKVYNNPNYERNTQSLQRIPDYRTQLFWEPNLQLYNDIDVEFFTSDVKGVYEILIKGFDDNNKQVLLKKYIVVE